MLTKKICDCSVRFRKGLTMIYRDLWLIIKKKKKKKIHTRGCTSVYWSCAIKELSRYEILSQYPSLTTRSRAINILLDTSFNRDLVIASISFLVFYLSVSSLVILRKRAFISYIQKMSDLMLKNIFRATDFSLFFSLSLALSSSYGYLII